MDIREMQNIFTQEASRLGDFHLMTKTELANLYCDADEAIDRYKINNDDVNASKQEAIKSSAYAALMLRYWYKIFEWAANSSSLHLELIDFVNWLSKGLYVAFYYRKWRYEYEAIVKEGKFIDWKYDDNAERIVNKYYYKTDANAPDKIINRCCGSIRGRVYQYYNKDKRKAGVQTYSIEAMVEDNGDEAVAFTGCMQEDHSDVLSGSYMLVSAFLSKGEGLEALIADGIANYDSYKCTRKEKGEAAQTEFDPRRLVKHLNGINQQFMKLFCQQYSISEAEGISIYDNLKAISNPKLYKHIQKTLIEIKDTPALLDCLLS